MCVRADTRASKHATAGRPLLTSDRRITHRALVSVQLTVALDTARPIIDHGEPFASKYALAVGAHEAVSVPWTVAEHDPTFADRLS